MSANGKSRGKKPDNGTPLVKGKGRNGKGQFDLGYEGGPGNPFAKLTHNLKAAIARIGDEASDKEDIKTKAEELARELWEMALLPGDADDKTQSAKRWAMQQVIDRALGKPKEHVTVEGSFTFAQAVREIVDRERALDRN